MIPARDRIIVALDVPDLEPALTLVDRLGGAARTCKVGLELFTAAGPGAVRTLRARGHPVFADLKLHDIPTTVERAAAALARLGVDMFTVHAAGGPDVLAAACRGARSGVPAGSVPPRVLAVTVLTHWHGEIWPGAGSAWSLEETTLKRAGLAEAAGVDGLVCAPGDVSRLRQAFGDRFVYVCPGVRLPGPGSTGEHGRAGTPGRAVRDGADYLVVGRPITRAADPAAAMARFVAAVDAAAAGGSEAGT